VIDPTILKVQAAKLLSDIPSIKRSTGAMAQALMAEQIYGEILVCIHLVHHAFVSKRSL
jgi:hypothetical protein